MCKECERLRKRCHSYRSLVSRQRAQLQRLRDLLGIKPWNCRPCANCGAQGGLDDPCVCRLAEALPKVEGDLADFLRSLP